MATSPLWPLAAALLAAAVVSAALIAVLKPLLVRYALARPNARSSHAVPTPQGGGIAVIAATFIAASPVLVLLTPADQQLQIWILFAATAFLAIVGAVDDIRTIEATPRLVMQFIAVGVVGGLLSSDIHIVPMLPPAIERILLVVAGVWLVNLTNFMDGIDWMTVTEVVSITLGLFLLALLGALPLAAAIVALALLGAILGFAPFNRPVARLFLGDVGSLPIGLLLFWLLLQLAGRGHLAAALLLPLYYLADATLTLVLRMARGESILQAHRTHFYQRATNVGWTVPAIITRVACTNALLVALAVASVWAPSAGVQVATFIAGLAAVALLLRHLTRGTS